MELLDKSTVGQLLGVCERTLENLVNRGEFPPPVYLGKRALWARPVVDTWTEVKFASQLTWTSRSRRRPAAAK